ncbi:MAG: maleate cis-trans isomerase family protein [Gammaproteobacteria bacterium]
MSIRPREYGRRGILGIGTPQANPTVETEFHALRPAGVNLVAVRLLCMDKDPEQRIAGYLDGLGETLTRFDDLQLDAFGFACTGSTYIRGFAAERTLIEKLEQRFGYPILTATDAIEQRLTALGARRIALVSPYPDWLLKKGVDYWQGRGFEVATVGQTTLPGDNLHRIYELTSQQALDVLHSLDLYDIDAILFSGTGMPSLRAIAGARESTGLPALSSNLCLAAALFQTLDMEGAELTEPDQWLTRLDDY